MLTAVPSPPAGGGPAAVCNCSCRCCAGLYRQWLFSAYWHLYYFCFRASQPVPFPGACNTTGLGPQLHARGAEWRSKQTTGVHDNARPHCQLPLNSKQACWGSRALGRVQLWHALLGATQGVRVMCGVLQSPLQNRAAARHGANQAENGSRKEGKNGMAGGRENGKNGKKGAPPLPMRSWVEGLAEPGRGSQFTSACLAWLPARLLHRPSQPSAPTTPCG